MKILNSKKMFSLINNQKYDEIIKIIDDETIQRLIENIVDEREQIGNNLENKLNNLFYLWNNNTKMSKHEQEFNQRIHIFLRCC